MKLTSVRSVLGVLVLLLVRDVLVGHKEQNHLALLILYGHDVQKTPELCSWREKWTQTFTVKAGLTLSSRSSLLSALHKKKT